MGRFVEGPDRNQTTLFPECLDNWIDEANPVRVIDAFVDSIDLGEFGFDGVVPEATGRPAYHPSVLLKLYIYSRRRAAALDENPKTMRQRRETVEHPFATIKAHMGAMHFLMKTLPRVSGETALHVLAPTTSPASRT